MPLIINSKLPTFERLRDEGEMVLDAGRAAQQDIREIHIGLLNMMPDAALAATERQFFRLVGGSNLIAQFHMHPFTFKELKRSKAGLEYVQNYYESFDDLKADGLDALIITGANVTQENLAAEPFWEPLIEVIDWATNNVTSILCSCLATHAVLHFKHGQKRQRLPEKCWGVFKHRVLDRRHPLVSNVNTKFEVPHSRYNEISREQFEAAGLRVLVQSKDAGVHLAVSEDNFRVVYFQGHPEYDIFSLLKEYKREVQRFATGEIEIYPPFPDNYFRLQLRAILDEYKSELIAAKEMGKEIPEFPESVITPLLDNTWHDTAESVINNWIGKVYQITNKDRKLPFMEGVDPNNPLGVDYS